jgi:phosphoribosylamine--glycine ligase
MKILVVGSGGREHALAWKIRQSPLVEEVVCAPGNPGMASLARCEAVPAEDIDALARLASAMDADLTVVGPETPMVAGIADLFASRGLPIFAPSRLAAEIEGSKVFAREFMARHGVPSPGHSVCNSAEEALAFVERAPWGFPLVIKADGLAAGKGAIIATDAGEARAAVLGLMADRRLGAAGSRVVMEEFLSGEEVSFLVFADGKRSIPMVLAQDHKRAMDGDEGPNTGGMGAVSPGPRLTRTQHGFIMEEVIARTLDGLAAEGRPFRGVLYAGIMMTPSGPRVLEFNARFGDPETQSILVRMKSDIVPVLDAAARGSLEGLEIAWHDDAAACVVIASERYPEAPLTGHVISGLDDAASVEGVVVFHAGTRAHEGKVVNSGGRVLGVSGRGASLEQALARTYDAVGRIHFDGMQFRRDIGQRALSRL